MPAPIKLSGLTESLAILGGISRSTFYEGIAKGRYPQPVKIAPHTARWPTHELEACVVAAMEARKPSRRKR